MTDAVCPEPFSTPRALLRLEATARHELARLAAALPPPTATDPLFAHLAWDLGLSGDAAHPILPAPVASG